MTRSIMSATNQQSQAQAEWTIMVYIAADDILANFAIESLKQLKQAANKEVIVAAQLDVDGAFARQKIPRYVFDGRVPAEATIDKCIVKTLDARTNMIDPITLTAFIDEVYKD